MAKYFYCKDSRTEWRHWRLCLVPKDASLCKYHNLFYYSKLTVSLTSKVISHHSSHSFWLMSIVYVFLFFTSINSTELIARSKFLASFLLFRKISQNTMRSVSFPSYENHQNKQRQEKKHIIQQKLTTIKDKIHTKS